MEIKFLDLSREADELYRNGLGTRIEETIRSGIYLFGNRSRELEEKLEELFNCNVALVGNGTDAITLILMGLQLENTNVLCPAFTAIPSVAGIKMAKCDVKYGEVDFGGLLCDHHRVNEPDISASAILMVHLYGMYIKDDDLIDYKFVIEDCAQAFGSTYADGKTMVGTKGIAGAFSLYPTKNLGCYGDAGFVVSKDANLIQSIKELRFYGQKSSYTFGNKWGMNSRVDEIQATILLEKLKIFQSQKQRKLEILKKYNMIKNYNLPTNALPHLYVLQATHRQYFQTYMKSKGIETAIHYPFCVSMLDGCKEYFKNAVKLSQSVVSIPFNAYLTNEEADYIVETIKNYDGELL